MDFGGRWVWVDCKCQKATLREWRITEQCSQRTGEPEHVERREVGGFMKHTHLHRDQC